jgi:hypothetical protein
MAASDRFGIQGHVSRGFEAVREAFAMGRVTEAAEAFEAACFSESAKNS